MLDHGNNHCMNVPQCDIVRTLPVLSTADGAETITLK